MAEIRTAMGISFMEEEGAGAHLAWKAQQTQPLLPTLVIPDLNPVSQAALCWVTNASCLSGFQ